MRRTAAVLTLLLALTPAALAVQPDEMLQDPVLEARARTLSAELRCMVCQNQSIDDSDAPLARDLRILVRERIKAGDTDAEVIDYLVDRYGEFVLLKPRFDVHTLLLWAAAPAALLAGLVALWFGFRRSRTGASTPEAVPPLSEAERAELERVLKEE